MAECVSGYSRKRQSSTLGKSLSLTTVMFFKIFFILDHFLPYIERILLLRILFFLALFFIPNLLNHSHFTSKSVFFALANNCGSHWFRDSFVGGAHPLPCFWRKIKAFLCSVRCFGDGSFFSTQVVRVPLASRNPRPFATSIF